MRSCQQQLPFPTYSRRTLDKDLGQRNSILGDGHKLGPRFEGKQIQQRAAGMKVRVPHPNSGKHVEIGKEIELAAVRITLELGLDLVEAAEEIDRLR